MEKNGYPFKLLDEFLSEITFSNSLSYRGSADIEEPLDVNVGVALSAKHLGEKIYKSTVTLNFRATIKETGDREMSRLAFHGVVAYSGVVELDIPSDGEATPDPARDDDDEGPPEDKAKDYTLMVEVPKLLYPTVRYLVGSITRETGFSPLILKGLNFETFYENRHKEE